jgi:secreted trypsin-like serine protease
MRIIIVISFFVSAAHCFHPKHSRPEDVKSAFDVIAWVGMHDLLKLNEKGSMSRYVINIEIHPDWKPTSHSFDADIALLHLEKIVDLTQMEFVRTVCLPPSNQDELTGYGFAVGYGTSERSEADGEKHDSTPNEVKLPIVPLSQCIEEHMFDQMLSNRTFCAGFLNQGKAVCEGDSGGGLYQYDYSTKSFILIGIISASPNEPSGGCNIDTYSMYTKVSSYVPWIHERIDQSEWTYVNLSITDE